jgi:S-adenosylmethionine:diacylglycerol 3-amino-3-carboxypropyl transferase
MRDCDTLPPSGFGKLLRMRLERSFVSEPWRAVHSIGFVRADAAEFLQQVPAGSFQAFSLSNIGDGVTREYAERLAAAVRHAAAKDAVVVSRSFREPMNERDRAMAAQDRSMIWGSVFVGPAKDFS